MDFNTRTRTISSLMRDIQKNKFNFNSPLQREEDQWNRTSKSLLIDSILRSYPIDGVRGIKEDDGTVSIIDGKQRLTTIRDYMDDGFSLSKDLKVVIIDDVEYEISGKRYSKLDESLQEIIKNYEMQLYSFTNCTYEDVQEMFRRQNGGKPLNNKQARTVYFTEELNSILFNLSSHSFMRKLMSKSQIKNSTDRDIIIQTLMLMETNNENDFTSFRSHDINNFIMWYSDNINMDKISILEQAMNRLDESFDTVKIPTTSIAMILYSAYRVTKDKKSFTKLIEQINDFISNYNELVDYKQYTQSGTSGADMVRGRLDYWRSIIRTI